MIFEREREIQLFIAKISDFIPWSLHWQEDNTFKSPTPPPPQKKNLDLKGMSDLFEYVSLLSLDHFNFLMSTSDCYKSDTCKEAYCIERSSVCYKTADCNYDYCVDPATNEYQKMAVEGTASEAPKETGIFNILWVWSYEALLTYLPL